MMQQATISPLFCSFLPNDLKQVFQSFHIENSINGAASGKIIHCEPFHPYQRMPSSNVVIVAGYWWTTTSFIIAWRFLSFFKLPKPLPNSHMCDSCVSLGLLKHLVGFCGWFIEFDTKFNVCMMFQVSTFHLICQMPQQQLHSTAHHTALMHTGPLPLSTAHEHKASPMFHHFSFP